MTTLFSRQLRDKWRLPEGNKTVVVADGGEAAKVCIDKYEFFWVVENDIVDIKYTNRSMTK